MCLGFSQVTSGQTPVRLRCNAAVKSSLGIALACRRSRGHFDHPIKEAIEHFARLFSELDNDPTPIRRVTVKIHKPPFREAMDDPLGIPLGRTGRAGERRQ